MIKHLAAAGLLVVGTSAMAQQRFLIERDIPGASKMTPDQLRDAARTSNKMLHDVGPDIQWVQSCVAGDKIYCVNNAASEALGLPCEPHHTGGCDDRSDHGGRIAPTCTSALAGQVATH